MESAHGKEVCQQPYLGLTAVRAVYGLLGSITLAAVLCGGAMKPAKIGASATVGVRHAIGRRAYRLGKFAESAYRGRKPAQEFDPNFNGKRPVSRYEGSLSGDAAGHQLTPKPEVREQEIPPAVEDAAAVYPQALEGSVDEASPTGPPAVSYLISTYAGGLPTATLAMATAYPLLLVTAVAVDPAGNTFISSQLNCVFKRDPSGNLTRVAGSGKAGYSGDGGLAVMAQLDSPQGLAVDLAGNLYIADYNNQRVRIVSPNGAITTVAGTGVAGYSGDGGPATGAKLSSPQGVAADSFGNLYIVDSGNQRIRRVAADGTITTAAGTGSAGYSGDSGMATSAQLCNPLGVAVDATGNLYIADTGFLYQGPYGNRIRMVSTSGIITTIAGTGAWGYSANGGVATASALENPYGVAVDSAGNVYIADIFSNRIREVSAGTITTAAGSGAQGFLGDGGAATSARLYLPEGVAVDAAGNLYIADSQNDRVRQVTAAGGAISTIAGSGASPFSGDGGPAILAQFSTPFAVATDSSGNVYFSDNDNSRVRMVAPNGAISTVAGTGVSGYSGDNGPATSARLDYPTGLATDAAGNLYIADSGSTDCRVRKVSTSGIITTVAGTGPCTYTSSNGDGGPATSAKLDPYGLAFDSAGNLYIADGQNNRVREVSTSGVISTVAGTGFAGYSGDGGPGTSAQLNYPLGLAVNSSGNVYIADHFNFLVRKLSAAGTIATFAGKISNYGASGDGGPATNAALESPQGVAVDSAGNVYISDGNADNVREVYPDGTIETIAGTGVPGYTGDGGPAVSAQLFVPSDIAVDAAGHLYVADQFNDAIRVLIPEMTQPVLTISSVHTGSFSAGQNGATYTVTVSNAALGSPTSGPIAVAETIPSGLTLVSMSGAGWNCLNATCSRTDSLSAGSPSSITVTVNVAANAPPQVSNVVNVSGGGAVGASAIDVTNIVGSQVLTVSKIHTGNFTQGETGVSYFITVANGGAGVTNGTVAVTDALPVGLTASAVDGTGWNCVLAALTCTRTDSLAPGDSYATLTVTANVAGNAPDLVTNTAAVWGGGAETANAIDPTIVGQLPDLIISSTHSGNFTPGQVGAAYSLTVTNIGAGPTSGAVTAVDTLPTGLTATAIGGTNWSCTLATLTCVRSDSLGAGGSYEAITVTVTVAGDAPASVTNTATVSGGGEINTSNDTATDPTTVAPLPELTIGSTHSGNFTPGQVNATYTVTVSNASGAGATSGTVTVTETVPPGETLVSMSGTGWNCSTPPTCTTSNSLGAGQSYPAITVTVDVAAKATSPQVNSVTVSGGGASPATATDSTTIVSQVSAPNVVGLTQSAATTAIDNAGLAVGTVTMMSSNSVPSGSVISESPVAGTLVNTGSSVSLVVSSGPATLQSIAVTPANPTITKGLTEQFTATGTYSDSSTQNLTNSVMWASGTPGTATIAAGGLATGAGVGTSTISATSGLVVGSTVLTVTAATLQSIAVTPANPSITKGLTEQFTATGTYSDSSTQNLTNSVTWASGTTGTATITTGGLATGAGVGTSTISATSGPVVGSTVLTVTAATLQSIAVTPANPSITKGLTEQFTATGTYSDSSTQNLTNSVTWALGTMGTATITTGGLATGAGVGTSSISATSGSVVGSTVLTVTPATLQSIAVTPANPTITKGLTEQFTATGTYSDSSTQNLTNSVTWASGTMGTATITVGGLATGAGVGTSSISATSGSVVGSTVLTVTAATLQSIAVTPANPTITKGLTEQFTATGTYSDSSTQNLTNSVTWASGTPGTATIATGGLATGAGVGTSTISATSGSVVGSTVLTVMALSECDVNQDGAINVVDVQSVINEALGVTPASNDLSGDGTVNVVDIQIAIDAAQGLGCTARSRSDLVASRR